MLNKAILMGRLVAEPELKHTPNNVPVLSITIAVDRSYSKDGRRETDFIDIVAWRGTAEFIAKYFRKGQMIAISGSIQTRNWEDKNGSKRKSTEVVADEAHFCGGKDMPAGQTEYDIPSSALPSGDPYGDYMSFETAEGEGELPF